ncbi:hypothetical protein DPMN_153320 [Dreissena polymorpha]|uniref:Uncharacterized protein n=1 Tax=Dreissena polymorpha TaxID=45954 RepID=A0A9D4FM49_DREPO|nr:hypothetical protein DPMN_153320 [Dreissena polymorpha]
MCSRYHYQEILPERLLRNDVALEQTLKDITENNKKVVDALRKLQYENYKVNNAIDSIERKHIYMEATFDDAIKTALTNVFESQFHSMSDAGCTLKELDGRVDVMKVT